MVRKFLIALMASLVPTTAFSTIVPTSASSNPELIARAFLSANEVEPEYIYCLADIKFFDNIKSNKCIYTIKSINISLTEINIRSIKRDDKKATSAIIEQFLNQLKRGKL